MDARHRDFMADGMYREKFQTKTRKTTDLLGDVRLDSLKLARRDSDAGVYSERGSERAMGRAATGTTSRLATPEEGRRHSVLDAYR